MSSIDEAKDVILRAGGHWKKVAYTLDGKAIEASALTVGELLFSQSSALFPLISGAGAENGVVALEYTAVVAPPTVEEAIAQALRGFSGNQSTHQLWLVFDESKECQLELLSQLWLSEGGADEDRLLQQLSECRMLLDDVWVKTSFKLFKVWRGSLCAILTRPKALAQDGELIARIVAYQAEYGNRDLSAKGLAKETARSGSIVI